MKFLAVMRRAAGVFFALVALLFIARAACAIEEIPQSALPPEATRVLEAIDRGGPFDYKKDGSIFGNREQRLPLKARGYYREYTVPTPGSRDRGAKRIVAGKGGEFYYTADHYRSFKMIRR